MEYESKRQKTPRSEKKKVGLPTKVEHGKVKRFPPVGESQVPNYFINNFDKEAISFNNIF